MFEQLASYTLVIALTVGATLGFIDYLKCGNDDDYSIVGSVLVSLISTVFVIMLAVVVYFCLAMLAWLTS